MRKKFKKTLLKESVWFFIISVLLTLIVFLKLSLIISGSLDIVKEYLNSFFIWIGWESASVVALIVTAIFISQQSYFTRKIFQFQTIPSVAFALMSNRTYYEKIRTPYGRVEEDTHFMIYNLSKFPISFWIEIKDVDGNKILNSGPWRINPMALFKPHNPDIIEILKRKGESEIYVTISYSSLHNDKLRVFEKPERWRLDKENRWVDRHGMQDINDRYWDNFLIGFVHQSNRKGTS